MCPICRFVSVGLYAMFILTKNYRIAFKVQPFFDQFRRPTDTFLQTMVNIIFIIFYDFCLGYFISFVHNIALVCVL